MSKEFDDVDLNKFVYLTRVPNSDKKDGLDEALKQNLKRTDANSFQLFERLNEPFSGRYGMMPQWLLFTSCFSALLWLIMILTTTVNTRGIACIRST